MDLAQVASLALIGVEFWLLGTASGIDWPVASSWLARGALRVLVGAVLVAVAQLALALLGIGFASVPLVLVAAGVPALLIRTLRVTLRVTPAAYPEGGGGGSREKRGGASGRVGSVAERAAWIALGLLLIAALLRSVIVPESGWDAYSHWGLRAQAYALADTITNAGSEHEYYPPLVPLLEAWLYLHAGQPSIDLGKTMSALIGGAFAVCLAWHLRLLLQPTWLGPLVAIGIVASTTALIEGFWTGQADLPLTAWLTLATLAAWQWQRSSDRGWLLQAGVFAAAAGMTKLEGTPRILVVAVLVLVATRGWKPAAALAVPVVCAALLWTLAAQRAGIGANSEHLGAFQPAAIGAILIALLQVFAGVRTGGVLIVLLAAWLIVFDRIPRLLTLIVIGQLALTLIGFLFGDIDPAIEVRTSATRLFEQWLPLALVAAAVGLRKGAQPIIGPWR